LYFDTPDGPAEGVAESDTILALLKLVPEQRRHMRVYSGLIGSAVRDLSDVDRRNKVLQMLVEWSSFTSGSLWLLISHRLPFCVVLDGVTALQARRIVKLIGANPTYAGWSEINYANRAQWAVYQLPSRYRVYGNHLSILYHGDEMEGDVEYFEGVRNNWRSKKLFATVELGDIGFEGTFLDVYDTPDHARLIAEVSDLLGDQTAGVANEIVLRLTELEPKLIVVLYEALQRADRASNVEVRAQVATSLRRFLVQLADVLFPPRPDPFEGRKVGNEEYKNRLWAYVKENSSGKEAELAEASLTDLGGRIDRVIDLVNKGLHDEFTSTSMQRLIIGLVGLTYDLLALTPPTSVIISNSRSEKASEVMLKMLVPGEE